MRWKTLEQRREYTNRKEVRERIRELDKKRRQTSKRKEYMKKYQRGWLEKNRKKSRLSTRKYKKSHPEKVLEHNMNYVKRHGFNMMKLNIWGSIIRTKSNNKCEICGSSNQINAHHIFYKSLYPKLMFNLNNGITLCKKHHQEIHSWIEVN